MSVLGTLARCGTATPGELARKEHVQPPSMTRIVALLEAKGLVRLEPHPDDRRQKVVTPDRAGRGDARGEPPQAQRLPGRAWPRASTRTSGPSCARPPPSWRSSRTCRKTSDAKEANAFEYGTRSRLRPRTATHDTLRPPTPPQAPRNVFSSLKIRNYRLFPPARSSPTPAPGCSASPRTGWSSRLTGSASAVGITIALQFLPMLLFGLYGGVLADRLPKRPAAARHPERDGPDRPRARRPHPLRARPGLARLPRRLPARPGHRRRQPGPAVLRLRDGRPGPAGRTRSA